MVSSKFDNVGFWKTIEEIILYSAEYENLSDLIDMLNEVQNVPFLDNDNFWKRMMEKVVSMR